MNEMNEFALWMILINVRLQVHIRNKLREFLDEQSYFANVSHDEVNIPVKRHLTI